MEHARHLKNRSKIIIFGDLLQVILSSLALFALIFLLEELYMHLSGLSEFVKQYEEAVLANDFEAAMNARIPDMPLMSRIIGALIYLLSVGVEVGYEGYCLKKARGQDPTLLDIIPSFKNFFRIMGITLVQSLIIGIGFALFIVPGVFLLYTYRQSYYVMFENPQLGIFDCMRESRRMMSGRRFQLFLHDVSFILWDIAKIIFSPVLIWIAPYKGIAHALFYIEIS